jgi:hypothetical protein
MTIEELYNLIRRHKHDGVETERLASQGIAAPSFRPLAVGLIYCDTTNAKVYISTGTTNANDWKLLN